jgi:hypothetical protein
MFETFFVLIYVLSTLAALALLVVAPLVLSSSHEDLEDAGVDLHGQGR